MADRDNTFEMTITGIADLQRAFLAIRPNLSEKVAKVALRQGANYLSKQIKAAAPVSQKGTRELNGQGRGQYASYPPGRLKRAIKVRQSRINTLNTNSKIGLFITVYPGKKRNDPKGAWYGKFVENGYTIGSRTYTARQAVTMGLITQQELDDHRSQSRQNQQNGRFRRTGRVQEIIRHRGGGRQIAGKHFVKRTFDSQSVATTNIIINAAELAFAQLVTRLGLAIQDR